MKKYLSAAGSGAAEAQAAILNAIPAHIALLDAQGVILAVNESWKRFAATNVLQNPTYGVGCNYLEVCERAAGDCSGEAAEAGRGLRRVLQGELREFTLEYPCHSPNEKRWFRLMVTPMDEQRRAGAVVMHINITERRLTEEALRASEEQFARAFSFAAIGMALVAPSGRYLRVNRALCAILGYTEVELLAKSYQDITHPEDLDDRGNVQRLLAGEMESFHLQKRYLHREGRVVWGSLSLSVVRDPAGRPIHQIAQIQDITEIKTQTDAKRALSDRLIDTLENLSDGFFTLDREWRFTFVNAQSERLLSCDRSSLLGRTLWEAYPAVIGSTFEREYRRCLSENRNVHFEEYYPPFDVWYEVKAHPGAEGLAIYFRDVTERKRAEAALRASEAEFRTLADAMPQIVWVTRADGWNIYFNQQWMDYTGMTLEESLGHGWNKPFHPDDQHRAWEAWQHATATGCIYSLECRLRRADGIYLWWLIRGVPQVSATGEILKWFGTCTDIDESKRTQVRIAEQAALIDESHDAIIVRDLEDHVTFWSRGAERLYGWTAAEAAGRTLMELLKPEPEKFHQAHGLVRREGGWSGEIQKVTKAGTTLTLDARWTLLRDAGGHPKSILGTDTDITERKKLERQFLRAQRMESIGTLAGGIAHDLNNLLAPITMGVELLRLSEPNPRNLTVIDTIERSARRGAHLVKQVLSFARGVDSARVPLQIRHILQEIESIAENSFPKNITLEMRVPQDIRLVLADPTQLNQVLLNLCVNARDAMSDGGRLELTAKNIVIDQQYAAMNQGAVPGQYIVIEVTDNGSGMPQPIIDRIFEPFFTTKEQGKGTGLGLSTVLGIVQSHGGFVNVYSELGLGSTFKVYLPVHSAGSVEEPEGLVKVRLPRGNGELIMIVDDEASVLDITKQTLQAFGYRAVTAKNGADAIALYALQRDQIALVITDMMMPVMDGAALIAALRCINPQVRVIAASGLNANANVARASTGATTHFLTKPYSAEVLLGLVRKILTGADTRPPI